MVTQKVLNAVLILAHMIYKVIMGMGTRQQTEQNDHTEHTEQTEQVDGADGADWEEKADEAE